MIKSINKIEKKAKSKSYPHGKMTNIKKNSENIKKGGNRLKTATYPQFFDAINKKCEMTQLQKKICVFNISTQKNEKIFSPFFTKTIYHLNLAVNGNMARYKNNYFISCHVISNSHFCIFIYLLF